MMNVRMVYTAIPDRPGLTVCLILALGLCQILTSALIVLRVIYGEWVTMGHQWTVTR